MVVFLIFGAVAGTLLGLCFKVLVLIPAFLLTTVIVIVNGSGHTLLEIVLAVLGALVSIQFGYIVGSLLRALALAHPPTAPRR
jgi:hypothetical protein